MADLAPEVSPVSRHEGGRGSRGRLLVSSHPEALTGEGRQSAVTALPGDSEVLAEVVTHVLLHHGDRGRAWDAGHLVPVLGPLVFLQVTSGGEQLATVSTGNVSFVWSVLTDSLQHK